MTGLFRVLKNNLVNTKHIILEIIPFVGKLLQGGFFMYYYQENLDITKNRKFYDNMIDVEHHIVKIDNEINWNYLYKLIEPYYRSTVGRPSIDPLILVKILLIQYIEGFRSVRFTCKQVKQNATYRWFLGISPDRKIPCHSTISKFLNHRLKDNEVWEAFFHYSNGIMTSGITHTPSTSQIAIITPGIYEVTFSVSVTEPNQFALFVNGLPVAGTIYGSGAGTQQNNGQAIVAFAAADVLTLRNHSSAAAVGLATVIGGTQANVNASIVIKKLN
jgi:transposase